MSAKIYLTNPKDAPFGKLSPLYDNLIPPISDKQLAIDKIGDSSSNLSCYVYAGLVKDGSIHRSLLEENPRDVNKKALIAYHQEQDRFLVDALENALKEKFKSLKSQRELLSTGDHYLIYRTNVTAFNNFHPNLVGEMMMNFRTLVRRKAAEYLIQHKKETQQRSWSRIYKVYQELKNRYLNGEDLAPYFYKTYDELFTLFKLNDVINITDVRQLPIDLQNVAYNVGHSAILPHLVIALNNNQLRYQQYLENLEKVRDAYFATIVPDKEERKRYVEKIPNLDNLTARIFFLWKRGFITIPEEAEANLKHEFLSVKRDKYLAIAKLFHRDMLTRLGYKPIIASDPIAAYHIIKNKLLEKEDTNKNHLTRKEIENNEKGEDIVIHDNDVNNPGSLLYQDPIEIDMKKFPTILHYVVYEGLVHLGMKNAYRSLFESDGKAKDIGYLFKDYSELLITYRNDIIEKRIVYSINSIYSSSLAEEGDKLPRLLVSTENKKLVYDFSVSKKIDKDSKCERCGSMSVNGECEQCNRMIIENVFAKTFISALTAKREELKNTVLPLSEQELPKTIKEKTMKTFFGKYDRYILEKMEEVMYAINLLMGFKITKVSSEEVDNLISLYCAGFNRFVVGANKMMNVRVILSRYVEMFKDRNPTDDFISNMRKIIPSVRREIINKLWDEAITLRVVMSVLNIDPDEKNVIFSEDDMVEKVDDLKDTKSYEKLKTQPSIQLYNHDTITLNVVTNKLPSLNSRNLVKRTKLNIELREAEAKGDTEKMEKIKSELMSLVPPRENGENKEYVTIHRHLLKNHIANSLINILYVLKTREWTNDELWFAFSILTTRKNVESFIYKGIQDLATYKSPRLETISHYLNKMKGNKLISHKNMFDTLFDYLIEELSMEDGILSRAMYFSVVPSSRILMEEVEGENEYKPDENIDLGVEALAALSSKPKKDKDEESLEESLEEDGKVGKGEKRRQRYDKLLGKKDEGDDKGGVEDDDERPQYEEDEDDGGDYVEEYGRFDDDEDGNDDD